MFENAAIWAFETMKEISSYFRTEKRQKIHRQILFVDFFMDELMQIENEAFCCLREVKIILTCFYYKYFTCRYIYTIMGAHPD